MIKKFLWLSLTLLALVVLARDSQAAIIRINAPKIELELEPGETYSGETEVENPTDQELKLRVYLEDWAYKPGGTGEKDFGPVGTLPLSAGKWIAFSPTEADIQPYGRVTVRYTIAVPPDAKGTYYSVLFFENILGTTTNQEGANVLVAGRIGSLFFVQIKGTVERSGKLRSLDVVPPQGNSPMEISVDFENSGNVDITLQGNFVLMDEKGSVAARGDLKKIYTQPGGGAKNKTEWVGRLEPGKYNLVVTFDLGKGKSLVEEKELIVR